MERLRKPFEWYGLLFLRITQAISRQQEYAADALAARVVGARPLGEGLKLVHGGALGFELYWQEDVVPAIEAGYRPPLLAGFTRFLAAPRARGIMDRIVAEALKSEKEDPYDTHPPLPDRLAALATLPARQPDCRGAGQPPGDGGWKVRALPGESVVFARGETQLEPFSRIVDKSRDKDGRRRLTPRGAGAGSSSLTWARPPYTLTARLTSGSGGSRRSRGLPGRGG